MKAIALAAFGAVPAAILGVVSCFYSVQRFSDPCLQWATEQHNSSHRGGIGSALLPPTSQKQNPCAQHISFTAQTPGQASRQVLLVSGGLLLGSALGFFGALYVFPLLTIAGAAILLLESLFIFSLAPLTFAGGLLLLLATRRTTLESARQGLGPCKLEN